SDPPRGPDTAAAGAYDAQSPGAHGADLLPGTGVGGDCVGGHARRPDTPQGKVRRQQSCAGGPGDEPEHRPDGAAHAGAVAAILDGTSSRYWPPPQPDLPALDDWVLQPDAVRFQPAADSAVRRVAHPGEPAPRLQRL